MKSNNFIPTDNFLLVFSIFQMFTKVKKKLRNKGEQPLPAQKDEFQKTIEAERIFRITILVEIP